MSAEFQVIAVPFFRGILNSKLAYVQSQVAAHPELILTTSPLRESVVHAAIQSGAREMVAYILSILPSDIPELIDFPTERGITPLHLAAKNGRIDLMIDLFAAGSQALDMLTGNGESCLYLAAKENHIPVVELLLERGSLALDHPNNGGITPIHIAAIQNHLSMVRYLYQRGSRAIAQPMQNGTYTPLLSAAERNHIPLLKFLLRVATPELENIPARMKGSKAGIILGACGSDLEYRNLDFLLEEEVLEIRHQVYFEPSLVQRLLEIA